jgi:membrane-associated HD superfamily phosphohydrolase
LLVVCIFWVLAVDKISSTIRQSKLSPLDRLFGLGFGVLRGAIVVILLVMMISALIPEDSKKGVFAESKFFVASEGFIEPIKSLIPEETMNSMQAQMEKLGFGSKKTEEKAEDEQKDEDKSVAEDKKIEKEDIKSEDKAVKESDDKEKTEEIKEEKPAEEKEKKAEKKKEKTISDNAKEAFMELAQPKIENAEDVKNATETFDEMSGELQKLMDALEDQTIEVDSEDYGL